jgi:hypothetical protein
MYKERSMKDNKETHWKGDFEASTGIKLCKQWGGGGVGDGEKDRTH